LEQKLFQSFFFCVVETPLQLIELQFCSAPISLNLQFENPLCGGGFLAKKSSKPQVLFFSIEVIFYFMALTHYDNCVTFSNVIGFIYVSKTPTMRI